jgi:hypothetical protein
MLTIYCAKSFFCLCTNFTKVKSLRSMNVYLLSSLMFWFRVPCTRQPQTISRYMNIYLLLFISSALVQGSLYEAASNYQQKYEHLSPFIYSALVQGSLYEAASNYQQIYMNIYLLSYLLLLFRVPCTRQPQTISRYMNVYLLLSLLLLSGFPVRGSLKLSADI